MDAVHERLRGFYAESFAKMLKVRKTSKNIILSIAHGDESEMIAKFNAEITPGLADQLLDQCKALVIEMMVDREMEKLAGPPIDRGMSSAAEAELPDPLTKVQEQSLFAAPELDI